MFDGWRGQSAVSENGMNFFLAPYHLALKYSILFKMTLGAEFLHLIEGKGGGRHQISWKTIKRQLRS